MVTDIKSNYTSPAGKEFTLVAGRFAGISPGSTVLDVGCGYGDGVCNMVSEFRCQAVAVDTNPHNLAFAQTTAQKRKISHLISFHEADIFETKEVPQQTFDLVLAEGGLLSFLGRSVGVNYLKTFLQPRGWLAFSDLVLLTDERNIPPEVLHIFDHQRYHYENEASYRKLFVEAQFDIPLMTLVPPSGWDNYYAHMARRLEDDSGFFADRQIKKIFHREIDIFYRLEGFRYIGYLFGLVRLIA